ncbi:hypothetical protein [Sphingobacterium kitahiroshimense]|uniref:hypothetical protein n=1 Tax=Sphingobacterium kitahiroshimense TaxID=470446 RepID=UPI00320879E8
MKINLQKYGPEDFNSFKTLVCEDDLMKYISGNGLNENQARASSIVFLKSIVRNVN